MRHDRGRVHHRIERLAYPGIPIDVAARLPKSGRVRVLVLTDDDADEDRSADYAQFLRDDPAEDAIYDGMT